MKQTISDSTLTMDFDIVIYIVIVFVIYKILDRLIRIPRMGSYYSRYIFITGCDSGFGNLLAKRLDQLGCHVFAGCLTEKGETELKKVSSTRLHAISLDVTKRESIRKALSYVKSVLPQGKGLWGLVNNAGRLTQCSYMDWLDVDDYKQECDVNLWGLIDMTLTFLPLVKKERGRIVNTSSIGSRFCLPMCVPYCISKYGVEAFTDGLRRLIHCFGCKAVLIEPGSFRTQIMTDDHLGRCITNAWKSASPEIKAEYKDCTEQVIKTLTETKRSHGSESLSLVVDAYEEGLFCCHPRARYVVGMDANYFILPLQMLPEWLGDWIWRKVDGCMDPAIFRKEDSKAS